MYSILSLIDLILSLLFTTLSQDLQVSTLLRRVWIAELLISRHRYRLPLKHRLICIRHPNLTRWTPLFPTLPFHNSSFTCNTFSLPSLRLPYSLDLILINQFQTEAILYIQQPVNAELRQQAQLTEGTGQAYQQIRVYKQLLQLL